MKFIKECDRNTKGDRAWVEIDLENLKNNVEEIKSSIHDNCEFMAVVKANGYGHGSVEISRYLNKINVYNFAVATINEAIELREGGVRGDILILGYTHPSRFNDLIKYDLIQTIVDYNYAEDLKKFEKIIRVHLKIDTGMHRLGEDFHNLDTINKIFSFKNLKIEAIFSHLYVVDSDNKEDIFCTEEQIKNFFKIAEDIKERFNKNIKLHIQNSYGALNYPNLPCDYVRIGISMYGVKSSLNDNIKSNVRLKPVLSIKARVAVVKGIHNGDSVSYGREFIAKSDMKVATVTIGYADGIPRNISQSNIYVLVNGRKAPIIGRVCMDQLMIDVTNINHIEEGDMVTLIGKDKENYISVEEVAEAAGTITNEFLSRLSKRLQYYYK
ncbi:serine racemase VanT catalytic subunit [Clostridium sp. NSJ-6]|uniref:Alanine racemase n=2 Tax=Clostridium hominis TaxID=2763036 RepID=A0ABR7DG30_9CLOT|nr:serine racemase VanT catalytic subunit [Clostridium hominis]